MHVQAEWPIMSLSLYDSCFSNQQIRYKYLWKKKESN